MEGYGNPAKVRWGRVIILYAIFLLALIIIAFQVLMPLDRNEALDRISKGVRVRPGNLNFLTVQAYHVGVTPTSQNGDAQALSENPKLLYLGRAGGSAVVYDFKAHQTWRISENDVLLQIEPCREYDDKEPVCDF
jgi:hypothetical protein